MKLSIIIPTLNEAPVLGATLEKAAASSAEIVVVDGGSTDGTVSLARQYTSNVVISPPGRGIQQDFGARRATGDVFLFLHADTRVPAGFQRLITHALQAPHVVFGAFQLRIVPSSPLLDGIALMANLRSRFLKMPYGDQGLFVRRSMYLHVGGFRHWPLMEDVDFVRRLNRMGAFRLVPRPVETSARRWEQETPVFTTLRNWSLLIRYFLGVSPLALARHYRNPRY